MLMNQRVDHHHASDVNAVRLNMRCSSSTDTHDVKQVLKDIQICIHAALNNRNTGIKFYSLGINTYRLQ